MSSCIRVKVDIGWCVPTINVAHCNNILQYCFKHFFLLCNSSTVSAFIIDCCRLVLTQKQQLEVLRIPSARRYVPTFAPRNGLFGMPATNGRLTGRLRFLVVSNCIMQTITMHITDQYRVLSHFPLTNQFLIIIGMIDLLSFQAFQCVASNLQFHLREWQMKNNGFPWETTIIMETILMEPEYITIP